MFENFALVKNCSDIKIWKPFGDLVGFQKVIVIAMIMIIMVKVTINYSMTVDYGHGRELCGSSWN